MIRINLSLICVLLIVGLTAPLARAAQQPRPPADDDTRDLNLRAYTELLRSDIRSQKIAIITEVMQFSEDEDEKFWPVYRQYESELAKVNDDRLLLIKEYAATYEKMTDDVAKRLASGSLDLEARRNAVKSRYYERLQSVLSPKSAARVLQIENQLLLLLDLQIAASLPIVQ
jgi:hypothetical protein